MAINGHVLSTVCYVCSELCGLHNLLCLLGVMRAMPAHRALELGLSNKMGSWVGGNLSTRPFAHTRAIGLATALIV